MRYCESIAGEPFNINSGIPIIKIADRIEVTVDLKAKRVSGPPAIGLTEAFGSKIQIAATATDTKNIRLTK